MQFCGGISSFVKEPYFETLRIFELPSFKRKVQIKAAVRHAAGITA